MCKIQKIINDFFNVIEKTNNEKVSEGIYISWTQPTFD
ncbi:hypothetical protein D1BOALGB6SA_2696 [Olavius sp. associated proteobacterium Delta 1]|nr:hypothetical protein D1BOALGB6SA_2696 [Olavius sp. associated proteobacterium Delta 1]